MKVSQLIKLLEEHKKSANVNVRVEIDDEVSGYLSIEKVENVEGDIEIVAYD